MYSQGFCALPPALIQAGSLEFHVPGWRKGVVFFWFEANAEGMQI